MDAVPSGFPTWQFSRRKQFGQQVDFKIKVKFTREPLWIYEVTKEVPSQLKMFSAQKKRSSSELVVILFFILHKLSMPSNTSERPKCQGYEGLTQSLAEKRITTTRSQRLFWYCWWKKSCTSGYGKYRIIFRVLYIPGGAGFVPSTVWTVFVDMSIWEASNIDSTSPCNTKIIDTRVQPFTPQHKENHPNTIAKRWTRNHPPACSKITPCFSLSSQITWSQKCWEWFASPSSWKIWGYGNVACLSPAFHVHNSTTHFFSKKSYFFLDKSTNLNSSVSVMIFNDPGFLFSSDTCSSIPWIQYAPNVHSWAVLC